MGPRHQEHSPPVDQRESLLKIETTAPIGRPTNLSNNLSGVRGGREGKYQNQRRTDRFSGKERGGIR